MDANFSPLLLLEILDELEQADFERFKLSLTRDMTQGFSPIPRSKMEHAKQHEIVDLMVSQYGSSDAAKITLQILKNLKQNNLVQELQTKLAKVQAGAGEMASTAASSSSSAPSASVPGASIAIKADGNSSVFAPTLSGGTFTGPVTMNCNALPSPRPPSS